MKIICFANNYSGATAPIAQYHLPDSSLQRAGKPLFIPDGTADLRLFPSLAIRINRLGKCIAPRFAHRYWDTCAPALSARMCDILSTAQSQGLPWDEACAFDSALTIGQMAPQEAYPQLRFDILRNNTPVASWDINNLIIPIGQILQKASQRSILKIGDIILLGLPSQGIPIAINDQIEVRSTADNNFTLRIK